MSMTDVAKSGFVDFIPEGEEAGSPYGQGGYQDFVPAPELVKEDKVAQEPKKEAEQPKEEKPKVLKKKS